MVSSGINLKNYTTLNVSNLKQSLKGIVHYNNKHNNSANPDGLYCHEDRPRVMIDGKSVRQRRFAILSSKEKNKLPPKSNKNVSSVIIDVLPSTIKRNLQKCIRSCQDFGVYVVDSVSTDVQTDTVE